MKPDYGIDAPGVRRGMLAAGMGGLLVVALAAVTAALTTGPVSIVATVVAVVAGLAALYGLGMGAYMTYASRIGKLRTREHLLDLSQALVPWTGGETVLDVGCGRGLMLVGAARRLTTGQVVGVDLWRDEDQARNTPDATLENARREGVAGRVRVETGDACALPFANGSFDVVMSHWVIHNIPDAAGRTRALTEMLRVLRPQGVLVLADIAHVADYRRQLATVGLSNLRVYGGGLESRIVGALSGGTFRPQALIGRRR